MNEQAATISEQPAAPSALSAALYLHGMGAIVLTVLGFFWLGWGYGWVPLVVHLSHRTGIAFGVGWLILYVATAILLLWTARAWRQSNKVRFGLASLAGKEMWRQRAGPFKHVLRYEATGVGVVLILALVLHRWDLLAAGISLVVGLHFFPLGVVFRIPAYYVMSIAIVGADLVWLVLFKGPTITVAVGLSTGALFWVAAIHLLLRLRRLMAARSIGIGAAQPAR